MRNYCKVLIWRSKMFFQLRRRTWHRYQRTRVVCGVSLWDPKFMIHIWPMSSASNALKPSILHPNCSGGLLLCRVLYKLSLMGNDEGNWWVASKQGQGERMPLSRVFCAVSMNH